MSGTDVTASAGGDGIRNLEGHTEFDVEWPWSRAARLGEPLRRGATAVLRVKDEARSLPYALPPLLRAVDRVLVVDNNSTDGTAEVARTTADALGLGDKLRVEHYPFDVARAGAEHLAVHEHSVHSLAYFYNWCFSLVDTCYSWKWDGDMVLTAEGEWSMADLSWQVGSAAAVVRIPRHGLYVADARTAYLDLGLRNAEEWGFPISPEFVHTKAPEWEIRTTPEHYRELGLPQGLCVELKWLDGDEFAHWTAPESFATSIRNRRKRREWTVFTELNEGRVPEGVVRVDAPDGVHVVDHVVRTWMPAAPRPFVVDDPAHRRPSTA